MRFFTSKPRCIFPGSWLNIQVVNSDTATYLENPSMAQKCTHIDTHQGDFLSVATFNSIRHIPGRGAVVLDAHGKICVFLESTDAGVIAQFHAIYKELIRNRVALNQPDWSFIDAAKSAPKPTSKA